MPPRKRAAKGSSGTKKYEGELESLSCEELRQQLLDIGEEPGPITSDSKSIYIRMLARKKLKLETETVEQTTSSTPPKAALSFAAKGTPSSSYHVPRLSGASPDQRKTPRAGPKLSVQKKPRMESAQERIAKFEVHGLVAAAYTPFTESGELNLPVIRPYVDHLIKTGVKAVFVNGTTGESLKLTVEERKTLVEEWVRVSKGKITVIVHAGTENLKYTCELAQHAEEAGAAAIGVMPPTFFKPDSIEQLILYLEKVGEAAPSLPMFYYHIPSKTGVHFVMEDFLEAASGRLPTLRGLKFTSQDLMQFGRCVLVEGGKYQIIYGSDEQVIGALSLGGAAAIGSTYNYGGRLYNRLLSAFQRSDIEGARLEQRRSQAMVKLLFKYGAEGCGKTIMRLCGVDVGPPRLPALPLPADTAKSLEKDLRDIGFFEWA